MPVQDPFPYPFSAPTPTLPIILVSVAVGLGSGVLGLYLVYAVLGWSPPWSAAATVFSLLGGMAATALVLSALHDPRTIGLNLGFSCGLMALLLAFGSLCMLVGAFAATLSLLF